MIWKQHEADYYKELPKELKDIQKELDSTIKYCKINIYNPQDDSEDTYVEKEEKTEEEKKYDKQETDVFKSKVKNAFNLQSDASSLTIAQREQEKIDEIRRKNFMTLTHNNC